MNEPLTVGTFLIFSGTFIVSFLATWAFLDRK